MSKLTRWSVLDTSTAPTKDGAEIVFGLSLRSQDTGDEYIVTVSGVGTTPGANFVNALRAAAAHIARSTAAKLPKAVSTERKH